MPSAKILSEKQAFVAALKEKMDGAAQRGCRQLQGGHQRGRTTPSFARELRETGVEYAVVKNTPC